MCLSSCRTRFYDGSFYRFAYYSLVDGFCVLDSFCFDDLQVGMGVRLFFNNRHTGVVAVSNHVVSSVDVVGRTFKIDHWMNDFDEFGFMICADNIFSAVAYLK